MDGRNWWPPSLHPARCPRQRDGDAPRGSAKGALESVRWWEASGTPPQGGPGGEPTHSTRPTAHGPWPTAQRPTAHGPSPHQQSSRYGGAQLFLGQCYPEPLGGGATQSPRTAATAGVGGGGGLWGWGPPLGELCRSPREGARKDPSPLLPLGGLAPSLSPLEGGATGLLGTLCLPWKVATPPPSVPPGAWG